MLALGTFVAALAASAIARPPPQRQEVFVARVGTNDVVRIAADALRPHGPGGPPPFVDLEKYTIGQILNWTLHHPEHEHEPERRLPFPWRPKPERRTLPIHRIAYLVNKTDDALKELLFDENARLTFLAPDDMALTPPHKRHGGHDHEHGPHDGPGDHHDRELEAAGIEALHAAKNPLHFEEDEGGDDDDDDDKREKRRRFFKKLLSVVLRYHVLDEGAFPAGVLADVATARTALPYSRADGDDHFRVRVRPIVFPKPSLTFNAYAFQRLEVRARNGVIHLISAPLLPPLSPLSEAFLLPSLFSALTSSVQKVELDSVLAPWLHSHRGEHGGEDLAAADVDATVADVLRELVEERTAREGKRLFTVFAPTNVAFTKIPLKIKLFLFSPLGRRALKAVLAYHIVPDVAMFTDYLNNATVSKPEDVFYNSLLAGGDDAAAGVAPHDLLPLRLDEVHPFVGHAKKHEIEFVTLLPNATLKGELVEYRLLGKGPIVRDAYLLPANGPKVKVFLADLPAWGGAIHAINTILRPPMPHHHHEHLAEL